jgi:hypothetical protein
MDATGIERTLTACEEALAQGGRVDLTNLGFWRAVSAVKRDRTLVERFGERIARIDREAFLRRAPIALPAWIGVVLEVIGTAAGVALIIAAPYLHEALGTGLPWAELAYIAGAGALIGMTHALTHWIVGGAMGIRFTHFYSLPPLKPQPGFKTDYATYLRTPARSRELMHASGALVSKAIPFVVAALAAAAGAATWALGVLLAIGVVQLITDVTLSTRASDWKKFRREMRFAR